MKKLKLSLIGEKGKYISSDYAVMWREKIIRVHTHLEVNNNNNNNSINSYLFAC
jgi:hypothetical protein